MEVGEIVSSVAGAGATTGGLVFWFIKRTVTEIFDDIKGLSIKIGKVDDKYQKEICDLEILTARHEARITALEKK